MKMNNKNLADIRQREKHLFFKKIWWMHKRKQFGLDYHYLFLLQTKVHFCFLSHLSYKIIMIQSTVEFITSWNLRKDRASPSDKNKSEDERNSCRSKLITSDGRSLVSLWGFCIVRWSRSIKTTSPSTSFLTDLSRII